MSRRRFVQGATAFGTVASATMGLASPASAQPVHTCGSGCADSELMTVWRLSSNWGYPRGPHNKTRLRSRASRIAAEHRWALTEQDAHDMNLHLCSWAPAEPVPVRRCTFMAIWDHNGAGSYVWRNPWNNKEVRLFDTRCLDHIQNGHQLWAQAFDLSCGANPSATAGVGGGSGVSSGTSTGTVGTGVRSSTGTVTNGAVTNSTVANGTVKNSTVANGSVANGTVTNGTGTTGTDANGTTASRRGLFTGLSTGFAQQSGGSETATAGSFGSAPQSLAFTGAESTVLARTGGVLAAMGASLSLLVHRRNKVHLATVNAQRERTRSEGAAPG